MDATLKDRFFETVYEHFKSRKCSLRRIIKTEYSFEEWFNCETILACSDDRFAAVGPRPFYDRCGAVACKSYGDILVEDGPEKLLVEIGMAHDGTYGKQLYKLENDRKKLRNHYPRTSCLSRSLCACLAEMSVAIQNGWNGLIVSAFGFSRRASTVSWTLILELPTSEPGLFLGMTTRQATGGRPTQHRSRLTSNLDLSSISGREPQHGQCTTRAAWKRPLVSQAEQFRQILKARGRVRQARLESTQRFYNGVSAAACRGRSCAYW